MRASLRSLTVAFLAADGTDHKELIDPWDRVIAEDGDPILVAPSSGKIQTSEQHDPRARMPVDVVVANTRRADFAALVLPGGLAGTGMLRSDPDVVAFVRNFFGTGKPVAAIGHAAMIIVEAGRVRDRTLTSAPSLRTEIEKAGGTWVDEPAVVCTRAPVLVTGRRPADLPEFCEAMVNVFAVLGRS